jgi:KUP system potassium uptake protein
MAVTGTITITTLLFLYVAHTRWRWPLWMVIVGGGALLTVDLMFLAANLTKLVHGAWLPLLIALVTFTVLITWQRGSAVVAAAREKAEGPLQPFIEEINTHKPPYPRVPGTAVFLNREDETAPLSMRANVDYNHVLHERVIILSIVVPPVPRVPDEERISVDDLGDPDDGIWYVKAQFGYMERVDVPTVLRMVDPDLIGGSIDCTRASYFLSKIELVPGDQPTMAPWRKRIFIATSFMAADSVSYFGLPGDQTVLIGSRIQV